MRLITSMNVTNLPDSKVRTQELVKLQHWLIATALVGGGGREEASNTLSSDKHP